MKKQCCAFTGHRPHKFLWRNDETDERCVRLKANLVEQITKLIERGITDFLSGMAEGTDLWAAQAVLDLREKNPALKLHCILPHKGQPDKWSATAREQYFSILEQADSIVYVNRDYHKSCMLERNRFLVDHASFLLAIYNGECRGGTAATVRYAQKVGREITILDPSADGISPNYKCEQTLKALRFPCSKQ